MTSQASSVNKSKHKSAFWVNFTNNLKSHWGIPSAALFCFAMLYPVMSILNIRGIIRDHSQINYNIANHFTFLITGENPVVELGTVIPICLIIGGVLFASTKFKFMNNKKEVNVYYSLGITRTKLFLSTYLAGFTQIILCIFIPLFAVWMININYFGSSKELTASILYIIISSIAVTTYAFTIASFVSSRVGSNTEVIIYSVFLAFLPNIILLAVEKLLELFVLGNEYSLGNGGLSFMLGEEHSLGEKFDFLQPMNCLDKISKLYMLDENKNIITSNYGENVAVKFIIPKLTRAIGWFITSFVVCILGTFSINKRPAEIAGFLGADKKTNSVMSFLFSFGISIITLEISNLFISETYKLVLIGLLAFILTYAIFNAILTRKKAPFLGTLKKLPIHLIILIVISLVFITGLFGYSKIVPTVDEVKSVDMIIPSGRTLGLSTSEGANSCPSVDYSTINNYIGGFKDKRDIKMITDLHKKLIKDGKVSTSLKQNPQDKDYVANSKIVFKYKLKNGKTLTRFYPAAKAKSLKEFLILENTQRYNELLKEAMIDNSKLTDKSKNPLGTIFKDQNYNVYIMSKHQDLLDPINLSNEQKKELVNCIYKDLTDNSGYKINCPTGKTLGSVKFYGNGIEFENPEEYFEDDDSLKQSNNNKYNVKNLGTFRNDHFGYEFIVTTEMKNTINYLQDNSLMKYFENKSKIVKAEVIDKKSYIHTATYIVKGSDSINLTFVGGRIVYSKDENDIHTNEEIFNKAYVTNDSSEIQELENRSYYTYFAPDNCYFVRYTLENNDKLIMCIPSNKIPSNIKTNLDNAVLD